MLRVVYRRHGEPRDVLELIDEEPGAAGPGEVIVAVEATPVHIAELKCIRGERSFRYSLPINPVTSHLILEDHAHQSQGDWLVQNAANSACGLYLIELAGRRGFRTVKILRRDSLVPLVEQAGGDLVARRHGVPARHPTAGGSTPGASWPSARAPKRWRSMTSSAG